MKQWQAHGSYLIVEILEDDVKETKGGLYHSQGKESESVAFPIGKIDSIGPELKEMGLKKGMVVLFSLYEANTPRLKDTDTDKDYAAIPVDNIILIEKSKPKKRGK